MRVEIREEQLFGEHDGVAYSMHCDDHDFHWVQILEPEESADPERRYFTLGRLMRSMRDDARCGCFDQALLSRFDPMAVRQ